MTNDNIIKLAALQDSEDGTVTELASLSALHYDQRRKDAAEELGIRASVLDRLVRKKRRDLGPDPDDDDKGQGRAVRIDDLEPWGEPVDGNALAGMLAEAVRRHVVLRDDQICAIVLWVLHTWLVNAFPISPRLAITSPTKGCGKTTVLRLLGSLARRPKRAGSISPPALFRVVETFQPTLLLDETEKYVEHGGDLHALLNEGHAVGGAVLRVLGENLELREFAVYGAAAFARNGSIPDDLDQRSIVIELQRRKPEEPLEEMRDDRCEPLRRLARMCSRWADDHTIAAGGRDPDMGGMVNRVADNWRPLFAIADTIGGDWPSRIRAAAARLAPREASSYGVVLLGDIKTIFTAKSTDRLASGQIVEALHELENRPWMEWGRSGSKKPISKNQLAGLLRDFKIVPETVRIGERTPKGYHLHQFEDAFSRYLSPQGVSEPQQRNKADEIRLSGTFQTATPQVSVAPCKCEKPSNDGPCCVVAVCKPPEGVEGQEAGSGEGVCQHCGGPEEPGRPVRPYTIEGGAGDTFLLHDECHAEWLRE